MFLGIIVFKATLTIIDHCIYNRSIYMHMCLILSALYINVFREKPFKIAKLNADVECFSAH